MSYDFNQLTKLGIQYEDAVALRRIAMTLHRWYELECGTGDGHIERDEKTGKPLYHNDRARYLDPHDPRAWHAIPDREAGAHKRLAKIMAKYPSLASYLQTDPRGAPLYILNRSITPQPYEQFYNNGVAVYR
jgi:hypothetical protein